MNSWPRARWCGCGGAATSPHRTTRRDWPRCGSGEGRRTVAEWMRRYEQPEQFLTLCRTLYLLLETGLATIE